MMVNDVITNDLEVSIVMGVPRPGWFIMENIVKMDDFGEYHYFRKPPYMKQVLVCDHLVKYMNLNVLNEST